MSKKIIGITGEMASGKTFSAKYLAEKYHADSYRFSTPLRDILNRIYIDPTRENITKLSVALRETFGQNIFSGIVARDASEAKADLVVIDGVRRLPDIEALKKLPQFTLIYLESDPKVRYSRLSVRGEDVDDNTKTWEQFLRDHNLETEVGIQALKSAADFVIENNGKAEDLYAKLDEIVLSSVTKQ